MAKNDNEKPSDSFLPRFLRKSLNPYDPEWIYDYSLPVNLGEQTNLQVYMMRINLNIDPLANGLIDSRPRLRQIAPRVSPSDLPQPSPLEREEATSGGQITDYQSYDFNSLQESNQIASFPDEVGQALYFQNISSQYHSLGNNLSSNYTNPASGSYQAMEMAGTAQSQINDFISNNPERSLFSGNDILNMDTGTNNPPGEIAAQPQSQISGLESDYSMNDFYGGNMEMDNNSNTEMVAPTIGHTSLQEGEVSNQFVGEATNLVTNPAPGHNNSNYKIRPNRKYKVQAINVDNTFIKTFDSLIAVAREYKTSLYTIRKYLNSDKL